MMNESSIAGDICLYSPEVRKSGSPKDVNG